MKLSKKRVSQSFDVLAEAWRSGRGLPDGKLGPMLADWMNASVKPVYTVDVRLVIVGKKGGTIRKKITSPLELPAGLLGRLFPEDANRIRFADPDPGSALPILSAFIRFCDRGGGGRLRNCRRCKIWFYARPKHKSFCSKKCQEAHYKDSDEWRAHRREYLRALRATHETGFVR